MELSVEEFIKLRDLIYERTGIFYAENKIYFIKKRLLTRMEARGLETVKEYINYLRYMDKNGREFQDLVNSLTINETYFFREYPQLEVFAEECLPEVVQRKQSLGERNLKIMSAGCSTGEEPYTLAIILREMLDDVEAWDIKILAVDIDEVALARAQRGIYDYRSIKNTPPAYAERYFERIGEESYRISPVIAGMVQFKHANLMDKAAFRYERGYDFIFCRNVLIYFDDESRKQVVERFYTMLKPGGFIFLGHSESISRITGAFRMRRIRTQIVYQVGMG